MFNNYIGDTLKLDISRQWNLNGFDAVIGNPPYQDATGAKGIGHTIWDKFVYYSIEILKQGGYLLIVHPSGWRSPKGMYRKVFDIIQARTLIFLRMYDFNKGRQIFNMGTNLDYYLLKNNPTSTNTTKIIDIDDRFYIIDLNKWCFIPSGKFDLFEQLITNNNNVELLHSESIYETRKIWMSKVQVLSERSMYGTDKKWISKTQDNEFIYPCIYTITMRDGKNFYYSNKIRGHFGLPKIIWSNGLGTYPIIDDKGEYGLTQYAYAIVDTVDNLKHIADALNHKDFIDLMKYVKYSNNKYNHKVIGLFKKDFWKLFI